MTSLSWEEPEDSGQLQLMDFDAVIRDTHESSATVTEHPVEEGANISDHIRKDLDRLTLEIVVSNTPIRVPKTLLSGISGRVQAVDITDPNSGVVLATANLLKFDGELDRVRTVYEEVLRLMNSGTLLSVFTSLRDYENMVIRRAAPVRVAASGNALVMTIDLTEISIAESEIVDAPRAAETRGRNRRNDGRQNPTETDETTSENTASFAAQGADLIGSLF